MNRVTQITEILQRIHVLTSVCLLLFGFIVSTETVGFRIFLYDGHKKMHYNMSEAAEVTEHWIEQPLDHFNVCDNRIWRMRYYENPEFLNGFGPIFIMMGGERQIVPGYMKAGLMYEIAKVHGAMMYYTEHRYYGDSRPVNDTSVNNLQYLTVDQALADVASFINSKKQENPNLANSIVIVFGGSYAGNMAAWARMKYPHLIQGAIASSAPVKAKADFFEYYDAVKSSLARYSVECTENIKRAFDSLEALLLSPESPKQLKDLFNMCQEPDISSPTAVAYLKSELRIFASTVQYNIVRKNGTSNITEICDIMMNKKLGSPMLRFTNLFPRDACIDVDYNELINTFKINSWKNDSYNKLWLYQTCTDYGYQQTISSKSSIFGTREPLEYYVQICTDVFGDYYNLSLLNSGVRRTNIMFGGSQPNVRNVVFTNGNSDPWHALSVLKDLNENSPAILINGSSHCQDLQPATDTDVVGLSEARKRVHSIIADWLSK